METLLVSMKEKANKVQSVSMQKKSSLKWFKKRVNFKRKAASTLKVSQKLILTILHDYFHYKPFKLHEWHKLEPRDYAARVEFATWFLSLPKDT